MKALIFFTCSIITLCTLQNAVAELKKESLPAAEQQLINQVDHWGLPFSDQIRRFQVGFAAQQKRLKKKAPKNFLVGVQHGLEKIPLNKYWFKGNYVTSVNISAARNEYENFQIAVLPVIGKQLSSVMLSKGDLWTSNGKHIISEKNITIYRVVHTKTAPARYPSLYTGSWPDLLLPNKPISVKGTNLGLFWVEIHVPKNTVPGQYSGTLLLNCDGEKVTIHLKANVFAFSLPDRVPFPVAVWLGRGKMPLEEYRRMCEQLLKHGIDPLNIARDFLSLKENDFETLDENIVFALERGQQVFEIPRISKNPEALKPLVNHLREKGWLDKALVYSNLDEPNGKMFREGNIPFYERMHALYPDLRVFLASEYHPDIDKGCDVWLNDLSTGKGFEFARKHAGRADLWTYYCHLPIMIDYQRPLVHAPNMQIDSEAIEHRLAFWLAWKHQTKGMFIYAGGPKVDWQENGWELSGKRSPFPYAGVHNGNDWLIYTGPHPSIRMKILRDGMEDLAYLRLLKDLSSKSGNMQSTRGISELLAIPKEVLVNPHYYNRDPSELLRVREAIALQIQKLITDKTNNNH